MARSVVGDEPFKPWNEETLLQRWGSSSYIPRVFLRVYCCLNLLALAMHQYIGERVFQDHRIARELTARTPEPRGRTERTDRGRAVIISAEERGP